MSLAWHAESLWEELEPLLPGLSVEVVASSPSTNSTLLERARAMALTDPGPDADTGFAQVRRSRESAAFGRRVADQQPCLMVAEHQTQGRGRMGRSWVSSRGASLTFSLSLPMAAPDWSGLSLAVGVALADALDPPAGRPPGAPPRIQLKWPNDLWLMQGDGTAGGFAGRKLGGILIESCGVASGRLAVIGVGLNVLPQPVGDDDLPHASLQEIDPEASAPRVLARVARALVQALLDFERTGFAPVAERFAARDLLCGKAVVTLQGDVTEHGIAQGVTPRGALRVLSGDGSVQEVISGEVSVRFSPEGTSC